MLTDHAKKRMVERDIEASLILELVETGDVRYQDTRRFWIAKYFEAHRDNLVCTAVVKDNSLLVIKTLMHHFIWDTPS